MTLFRRSQRGYIIEPEEIFLDSLNPLEFDQGRHEGRIERSVQREMFQRIFIVLFLIFSTLFVRVAYLQIVSGNFFSAMAETQSLVIARTNPPRGHIIDRTGAILAGTTPSFDLVFYSSEFEHNENSLGDVRRRLAGILGRSEEELIEDGFPADGAPLSPQVTVARAIDSKTLLAVQAEREYLAGVFPEERFHRTYEGGPAFSHMLGYLGFPSAEDLTGQSDGDASMLIGKLGIERSYDQELGGTQGKKIMEIDARRTVQRIKTIEPTRGGATIRLTIDAGLQKKAYETMREHIRALGMRAGALVALDPRDGSIRALVSHPSFDNNRFAKKLSRADVQAIFEDPDKPLFNRAVSGEYPPGSTIKPVIAAAALEENIIDPKKEIFSEGFIQIPNPYRAGEWSIFKDWKPLGWMNIRSALAYSSNVYFYSVGGGYQGQQGLGIERIKRYEELFGLGSVLGIDIPGEGEGFVPDPLSTAEKRVADPLWRIGDTYNASIGQGDTLVTPLHIASYTAVFANGGTLYSPRIVETVIDPDTDEALRENTPRMIRSNFVSGRAIDIVREGMRMAVTEGSARRLSSLSTAAAGKTGTAETGRRDEAHAWFTGFAPYDKPELVITVLVEKGGEGSIAAVPIAEEVLRWYFDPFRSRGTP